jgi:hypothetical protein
MQTIAFSDPEWQVTFPHQVTPNPDEWLPGLLLRCDEMNHWASRTTLAYVLSSGKERFDRTWRTDTPNMIVPARLNLDFLASILSVSKNELVGTTYQAELARCYDDRSPYCWQLGPFSFRLCPVCLAEARWIRRMFLLPQISCCQEHQVVLLNWCQCGTPLQLFSKGMPPFVCPVCKRDWAELSRMNASAERLMLEQKYLSYYAFFFDEGTPTVVVRVLHCIATTLLKMKKNSDILLNIGNQLVLYDFWSHISLSTLVDWLILCDLSLSDIICVSSASLAAESDRHRFYLWEIREVVAHALQ